MLRGCDNTARKTASWAARAGVDRATLYQALASRGGYCDCEVLMNAASQDDEERGLTLVVGEVERDAEEVTGAIQDFMRDDTPPPGQVLEPAESTDSYLGLFIARPGGEIPLQVTDTGTLGEVLRTLAQRPPRKAQLRMLAGFVGEPPTVITAGPAGTALRFVTLPDDEPAAAVEARWPGLPRLAEALRAAIPPRRE
jgi:hypothetical protein